MVGGKRREKHIQEGSRKRCRRKKNKREKQGTSSSTPSCAREHTKRAASVTATSTKSDHRMRLIPSLFSCKRANNQQGKRKTQDTSSANRHHLHTCSEYLHRLNAASCESKSHLIRFRLGGIFFHSGEGKEKKERKKELARERGGGRGKKGCLCRGSEKKSGRGSATMRWKERLG